MSRDSLIAPSCDENGISITQIHKPLLLSLFNPLDKMDTYATYGNNVKTNVAFFPSRSSQEHRLNRIANGWKGKHEMILREERTTVFECESGKECAMQTQSSFFSGLRIETIKNNNYKSLLRLGRISETTRALLMPKPHKLGVNNSNISFYLAAMLFSKG